MTGREMAGSDVAEIRPFAGALGRVHRGEERLGIRVLRIRVEICRRPDFHYAALIHHSYPIGQVSHNP